MAKKNLLIARLYIEVASSRLSSNICYIGVNFQFIENRTDKVVFSDSFDITPYQEGLRTFMVRATGSADEFATMGLKSFEHSIDWRMNAREPKLSELDRYVKSAKSLKNKMEKHNPEDRCDTLHKHLSKLFEVAKVDEIWFEELSQTEGRDQFTKYSKYDLEKLLNKAVDLLDHNS